MKKFEEFVAQFASAAVPTPERLLRLRKAVEEASPENQVDVKWRVARATRDLIAWWQHFPLANRPTQFQQSDLPDEFLQFSPNATGRALKRIGFSRVLLAAKPALNEPAYWIYRPTAEIQSLPHDPGAVWPLIPRIPSSKNPQT